MKSLERQYVWWPGIDRDVEKQVQVCQACQMVKPVPSPVLGNGQDVRGHVYTWTLRVRWKIACFW